MKKNESTQPDDATRERFREWWMSLNRKQRREFVRRLPRRVDKTVLTK